MGWRVMQMAVDVVQGQVLLRDDLPLLIRRVEIMPNPEIRSGIFLSKDIRWQTHTDSGADVHIDHHFDDE